MMRGIKSGLFDAWRLGPGRKKPGRATPWQPQAQVCDCGLAALGMILAHHGRPVPLAVLRDQAGASRDGTSAAALLRLARAHGLEARGWRKDPRNLASLGFPLIVHSGFNHFVVVEGLAEDRVWVNDPASGPAMLPRDQFEQAFTGVALGFAVSTRPSASASASASASLPGRGVGTPGVWDMLPPGRWRWLGPAALALAGGGCVGGLALSLGQGPAGADAVTTGMLILAAGALAYGRERWRRRIAATQATACLQADGNRLRHLPAPFFSYRGQALTSGLFAGHHAAARIGGPLVEAGLAVVFLLPLLAAALWLDRVGGLTLAGLSGVALAAALWRGMRRLGPWEATVTADMIGTALHPGVFFTLDAERLGGRSEEILAERAGIQARALAGAGLALPRRMLLEAVPQGLGIVLPLAVVLVGSQATVGALGLLAVVAADALARAWSQAEAGREAHGWLLRRLDLWQEPAASAPPVPPPQAEGLTARELVFGYHAAGEPLLAGLSLRVRPGEAVGVTGGGGAGKSTLAALLAGILAPWSGTVAGRAVLVDGFPMMVAAPLREAVRLWRPQHDDAAVAHALADAGLGALAAERQGGLDMQVEAHGRNLSGGQRIRLGLARALLDHPMAVVLDEALDALDGDVERHILRALRRRGCAVVIISHRASTLEACDRVLTLDRGRWRRDGQGDGA